MNKADDNKGGGGGNTEPKDESKGNPPAGDPKDQAEGDSDFDELGYAKDKSKNDKPKEESKDKDDKEKKSEDATGYGKKPEPDDKKEKDATGYSEDGDAKEDDPGKDENESDDKEDKELKLETGELLKEEVKEIRDFAKTNKLSKEQAQALVNAKISEVKNLNDGLKKRQQEAIEAVKKQKQDWHKELLNDQTFGGKNFDESLNIVNRVVREFMPDTKKVLTDKGTMLPPYVMRDLLKLGQHLYKTDHMVDGEPTGISADDDKKELNPLDFYNQKIS